jgi:hypothetical protein
LGLLLVIMMPSAPPEKDLDQGQTFLRIEQWSYGRAAMQNSATQYPELRRLRLFQ